jgi:hypothetical protein
MKGAKKMKERIATICLAVVVNSFLLVSVSDCQEKPAAGAAISTESPAMKPKPLVQMAILLDTSGSMTGLIDQARTELWAIVNEFIFVRRNGLQPELQVALYEYGKDSLSMDSGYIRRIVPFTTDLDKISEELFALKTSGGDEYCGWVISEATKSLRWSDSADDLKVIFIAGNEPFTQGPINYQQACKEAIAKGIVVNTIHCGSEQEGIIGKWQDGAVLADGKYLSIDQNRQVVHVAAPQDKEIAELGVKLNNTYLAFGRRASESSTRQVAQDKNAAVISAEAQIQRAVAKSSYNYKNADWDLVDAVSGNNIKLEDMKTEDLPLELQKMTTGERKAYVETKAKERTVIQQKIQQLNDQRQKYAAEEVKKLQNRPDTLGKAVTQAIRQQAQSKNFVFENSSRPSGSEPNSPSK